MKPEKILIFHVKGLFRIILPAQQQIRVRAVYPWSGAKFIHRLRDLCDLNLCCGSKYIEFGPGSRILAQFMLSILKIKIKIILDNKKLLGKITFFNTKVPNTDLIWIRIHNWLV